MDYLELDIETNHATLAGHSMMHELEYAAMQSGLGSIDANTGDVMLGSDTDWTMLVLLKYGIAPGGMNFDAKVRRKSFGTIDLFYAHIGGMDAFAHSLRIATAIRADNAIENILTDRYSSFDSEIGGKIESGSVGFKELEAIVFEQSEASVN